MKKGFHEPLPRETGLIDPARMQEFLNIDMDDINYPADVPQLGKVSHTVLTDDGVTNLWQLCGKFLSLRADGVTQHENEGRFIAYLEGAGVKKAQATAIGIAISWRIYRGVTASINYVDREPSKMNNTQTSKAMSKSITGQPDVDILGIGDTAVRRMKAQEQPITSTYQLAGKMLEFYDPADPDTSKARMVKWLTDIGVSPQWCIKAMHNLVVFLSPRAGGAPGKLATSAEKSEKVHGSSQQRDTSGGKRLQLDDAVPASGGSGGMSQLQMGLIGIVLVIVYAIYKTITRKVQALLGAP